MRRDSNRYHDIVFFNSLVHDAGFAASDLRLRGNRLTIPIKRDCWEIPSVSYSDNTGEMYTTTSRITISPVTAIAWEYDAAYDFGPTRPIELQDIWLDT